MTAFRVWAPRARRVRLAALGTKREMVSGPGGWWTLEVPAAGPGVDYAYVLDDGDPLPDPRSPWQASGVHGPSRTVDPAAFAWSDAGFRATPLSAAVIYELHVGTFTPEGTFDSAIAKLDYLADLGVTHVELMPVAEFAGSRGWGYDGVDLYAPAHGYGGPEALKRLVDACHRRGVGVLLDVVYNHLGPAGNYLDRFGPYFSQRHATPWGPAVNLDGPGSDEVRRFFCENAVMWLRDYHVDGLRVDAIHAIVDRSAVHFLEQLAAEVDALEARLGRPLVLIAESHRNDPRVVWPVERGGLGVDAQWSDDFHHALHAWLTGERDGYYADFGRLDHVARALRRGFVYEGAYSAYWQRRHGRPAEGLSGHQLVGYLQNHDQVGNRAQGERVGQIVSPGCVKIGAALTLTAPFVPLLFQGEEWGASAPFLYFTDHEPELGRAVSQGRREEFRAFAWGTDRAPDPQDPATFQRSRLDWSEAAAAPHAGLLDWYRHLIRLRRATPALSDGRLDRVVVRFDEEGQWLVVTRDPVEIVVNRRPRRQAISMSARPDRRVWLASGAGVRADAGGLDLPGESVAICGPGELRISGTPP